jgi:peptide/nickel transport system permease protein
MRLIDALISIPPLILSLLVLGVFGPSPLLLIVTIGLVYAPRVTTVARSAALQVVTEDFVTVAKARGESALSIVLRELAPNSLTPLLVEFAMRSGFAVIMIGSLGFLGYGVSPPTPEWGLMISESRNAISAAPWTVLFPGLAMASMVIALNLTVEGIGRVFGHAIRPGEAVI